MFNHGVRVRMALLAAALFMAACGSGQPASQPTAASIKGAGSLSALHMIDANAGWAYGPYRLERTTDGAHNFADVTPPGVDSKHAIRSRTFLDAERAWVLVGEIATNATETLQRTSDGGATWTRGTTISSPGAASIQFVDSLRGWLIVSSSIPDCLASSTGCGFPTARQTTLKQTTDGGATWTVAYQTLQHFASSSLVNMALPGISGFNFQPISDCGWYGATPQFLSAQIGYAGLSCPGAVGPFISATIDGGHTWRRMALPAPPEAHGTVIMTSVDRIHFFSARDGVAFVSRCTGDTATCVQSGAMLYTHDRGSSWSMGQAIRATGLSMSAVDSLHAWVPDASLNDEQQPWLLATADSGTTWEALKVPSYLAFPQSGSRGFQFVTPSLGFAWIWTTSAPDLAFYRTDDGGHSFQSFTSRLS